MISEMFGKATTIIVLLLSKTMVRVSIYMSMITVHKIVYRKKTKLERFSGLAVGWFLAVGGIWQVVWFGKKRCVHLGCWLDPTGTLMSIGVCFM